MGSSPSPRKPCCSMGVVETPNVGIAMPLGPLGGLAPAWSVAKSSPGAPVVAHAVSDRSLACRVIRACFSPTQGYAGSLGTVSDVLGRMTSVTADLSLVPVGAVRALG
jgi:hypothetical protein